MNTFFNTLFATVFLTLSCGCLASVATGVPDNRNASDSMPTFLAELSKTQPEVARVANDIVNIRRERCGEHIYVARLRRIITQDPAYYELLRLRTTGEGNYLFSLGLFAGSPFLLGRGGRAKPA